MNILILPNNNLTVLTNCPEEEILWNYIDSLRTITRIVPLIFCANPAGSEFLTYNANKLYLALDIELSNDSGTAGANEFVTLYNLADTIDFYLIKETPVWNGGTNAINYVRTNVRKKFIIFSRIVTPLMRLNFNGYRLTIA